MRRPRRKTRPGQGAAAGADNVVELDGLQQTRAAPPRRPPWGVNMVRKSTILLAFLLSTPSVQTAEATARLTTGDFLAECKQSLATKEGIATSTNYLAQGRCLGYMDASRDFIQLWRQADPKIKTCIPNEVETWQLVRVYVKWGDAHPERHHEDSFLGVVTSLASAFPCAP